MRFPNEKPDLFDLHRKDHSGRPFLIVAAFLSSIALWAALVLAGVTLLG